MALPADYWQSYEGVVGSLSQFLDAVQTISAYQSATGTRFVWRGVRDSSWGLHSSLSRAYLRRHGSLPTERQLRTFEDSVIAEARDWALDWHPNSGRLGALELLAALQHHNIPTRMLDFTFNPLIALWFAVDPGDADQGRVFAIDTSDRLVTREDALHDELWWLRFGSGVTTEWATQSWIWRPPPFEPRIVRQEGCFLMGGVPSTQPARNVRPTGVGVWRMMHANEVRECMSVPFQLISYQQAVAAAEGRRLRSRPPKVRAFTLLVENKSEIAASLVQAFGYSHRSLFPDFSGLATFGRSFH